MAGSRDVLNAFGRHVTRLLDEGRVDEARRAWEDFVTAVAPSFPPEHRGEEERKYAEFLASHPPAGPETGG
jgi:hypothetical protein